MVKDTYLLKEQQKNSFPHLIFYIHQNTETPWSFFHPFQ